MTRSARILAAVEDNRAATSDTRPMPTTADNISFAQTEAIGELLEAQILRPKSAYQRNHAKEHSPQRELAQTMHQIASALITMQEEQPPATPDPWIAAHCELADALQSAAAWWNRGRASHAQMYLEQAMGRAIALADLMGLDPEEIVEDENRRILAKEAAKREAAAHA
jgi:hypothetical protein